MFMGMPTELRNPYVPAKYDPVTGHHVRSDSDRVFLKELYAIRRERSQMRAKKRMAEARAARGIA
jgi:hypothetical protein